MKIFSTGHLIATTAILGILSWEASAGPRFRLGLGSFPMLSRAFRAGPSGKPQGQWPMLGGSPQRNMANPFAKNLPTEWDLEKKTNVKWVALLGSRAFGVPAIADGRIFVGTNNQRPRDKAWLKNGKPIDLGVLMCFRESDGEFLWQAVHEKLPGGAVNDWPHEGLCSTPAVEGERLYYVSNRCELICAGVRTGKAIWTLDMIKELGVFPHAMSSCSPLVVGDAVFVVTSNGVGWDHVHIPAPQAPSFLAVDKNTGKVLWQNNAPTAALVGVKQDQKLFKQLIDRGEVLMHGQWSSPAYGVVNGERQVIFPGGDGWLYAFTPAGQLLWKFDCNPKNANFQVGGRGTRSEIIALPVIHNNRVYVGVGQDPEHEAGVGHLWCIDMNRRGDVSPELRVNNKVEKNPNSALVWHYGGDILDPKEQARLGRRYYFGRTLSTCAIHDGLLYISELGGILHCLDADSGRPYWTHDTRSIIWGSPCWADGKIYLGTDQHSVFVFQHGKQKKLLAEIEMDSRLRTAPVAVNHVLYIATETSLYALALDKSP